MGTESKSDDYTLYLDGVPIARGEIQLPEIVTMLEPMEFTVTITTPKRWRCRGRKRFIKLMMSEGISRNYAEWLADFTRTLMPYGEAWRNYLLHKFEEG